MTSTDLIPVRASQFLLPEHGRMEMSVPAEMGFSLAEIVAQAMPLATSNDLDHTRVTLVNERGMVSIEREHWHRVRPRAGATVVIRVIPGDEKLRSILSIVVSIAALAVTTFLTPYLAGALQLGATGTKILGGVLSIGTLLLGTLAINALIPPPEEPDAPKSLYTLSGWRNQMNPGGVIPVVLGKIRYAPPFAITPYTEIDGKGRQWVCAMFNYGYGRLEYSKHRIGETPLSDYDDYRLYERRGASDDNSLNAFPDQVMEESIGTELVCPLPRNDKGDITGDTGTPEPVTRTLARDSKKAGIILLFPQGLVRIENDGDEREVTMSIRVRSRQVDTGPWTYEKVLKISRSTRDPFYVQHTWKLDPRGTYETQITRLTNESDSTQKIDRVSLVAIQSYRPEYPINFDKRLALVGIKIRASYQLSGALDSFNSVVSRYCPDWDYLTETWVNRETRNPASFFRFILQGDASAKPVADAEIDFDVLQDWHDFCRIKGLHYDRVHDFEASLEDALKSVAAAGRAAPRFDGRKWGVVIDRPQTVVVDQISARNSKSIEWQRSYFQPPDALRIPFLDRTNDFLASERLVPWPGVSPDDIEITEQLNMSGKTDPDEVWIESRRMMHSRRFRPDSVRVVQEGAVRVATRGDLVALNHDVLVRSLKAARVKAVDGELIELDDSVVMEAGTTYAIRWQVYSEGDPVGDSVLRQVITNEGEHFVVTLVDDADVPDLDAIIHFGPLTTESMRMIVQGVEAGNDMTSVLTLIAASDEIDDATDAEEPPVWSGRVGSELEGLPDEPGIPSFVRIASGVSGTGVEGGLFVQLSDDPTSDIPAATYEVDHRLFGAGSWTTETIEAADGAILIEDYEQDDIVEVRARARSLDDTPGPYADTIDVTIGETDDVLPDALDEDTIAITGGMGNAVIEGATGPDLATVYIQIYRNQSSDPGDLDRVAHAVGEPILVTPDSAWAFTDGDPSRTTLIYRGDFSSGKGWTKGTGWSVGDGVATKTPGTSSAIYRNADLVNNAWYRVRFDVEDYVDGTITPRLGGGTPVNGTAVSANGRFYDRIQADAGNDLFVMLADNDFDGSVDDLVIFRESSACIDQGEWFYWFEPKNAALVAGPLSSPFAVTII